uniref:Uncharacterized protein n=1 Tax=Heterorhabditis bacteriophora TaxID=37862 RepID=A0A1I7XL57_HETBA
MHFSYSSPSSSSQSEDDCRPETSATQLLSLAIQKRRALYARKERDYRQELLQTGFIQFLCKHLGERRARRRRRGKRSVRQDKGDTVASNEAPSSHVDPIVQNTIEAEPDRKRARPATDDDPFGLDEFFARVYGRPIPARG